MSNGSGFLTIDQMVEATNLSVSRYVSHVSCEQAVDQNLPLAYDLARSTAELQKHMRVQFGLCDLELNMLDVQREDQTHDPDAPGMLDKLDRYIYRFSPRGTRITFTEDNVDPMNMPPDTFLPPRVDILDVREPTGGREAPIDGYVESELYTLHCDPIGYDTNTRTWVFDLEHSRVHAKANPSPVCIGCSKRPSEIAEYGTDMTGEEMTADDYVRSNEGTFNPANGHFLCTDCYVGAGSPSSPRGWTAP